MSMRIWGGFWSWLSRVGTYIFESKSYETKEVISAFLECRSKFSAVYQASLFIAVVLVLVMEG
jgi:hypothetical protein